MKPAQPDDPEFEQVRSLLREQYAELDPKRPGWVARLAQKFQPPEELTEPEWVAQAAPVLEQAASSPLRQARRQKVEPAVTPPPPGPAAQASLPELMERLAQLALELQDLAERDLGQLREAA